MFKTYSRYKLSPNDVLTLLEWEFAVLSMQNDFLNRYELSDISKNSLNIIKNRYMDIFPYDHNIIPSSISILEQIKDIIPNDKLIDKCNAPNDPAVQFYICASFISRKRWIQSPSTDLPWVKDMNFESIESSNSVPKRVGNIISLLETFNSDPRDLVNINYRWKTDLNKNNSVNLDHIPTFQTEFDILLAKDTHIILNILRIPVSGDVLHNKSTANTHNKLSISLTTPLRDTSFKDNEFVKTYNLYKESLLNSDIEYITAPSAFIACQAPIPDTISSFFEVLMQSKCNIVIMLTDLVEGGKQKAHCYWPNHIGLPYTFIQKNQGGKILLEREEWLDCDTKKHLIKRILYYVPHGMNDENGWRIKHYHYISWPDKDVPGANIKPVLALLYIMFNSTTHAPICIHCSAGVGRTGTIIALYHGIEAIKQNKYNNNTVYQIVQWLRHQRTMMVQAPCQYQFIYTILECILSVKLSNFLFLNQ